MSADISSQIAERVKFRTRLAQQNGKPYDPVRRWDLGDDPGDGVAGMPPNLGDFMIPHVGTFVGLVSSQARTYRASDEALRNSAENARYMRNDPVIMECVEMRQRACALLDWHLEPEDPHDSAQVDLVDKLTKIIERIPRFMQYRENLLNATWFGRYGVFHKWGWKRIGGDMRLTIDKWKPVHGDKLVWRYDDDSGRHRPDQLGIRVGAAIYNSSDFGSWMRRYSERVEPTDWGLAYFLDSWQQTLVSVHKHFIEDGEWEDPFSAGAIHGRGLRSRLYWTWFQKQETLAFLMEFLERSAAGIEIWSYPMGNPQAEAQVRKAAIERGELGRNVLLVPKPIGEDPSHYDVQRIEPGMGGAGELKSLITEYYGHQIKRYILGQTLTTEADATGLGSGLAEVHLETFMGIVRYDATLLEETLTEDLIEPIKRYNFPEAANIRVNFRIDTEQPDSEAKMQAMNMAWQMGLSIRGQDLRDIVGAAKPEDDDEMLSFVELQKQIAEAQPQDPMMGGMPGEGDMADGVDQPGEEQPARMSAAQKPVKNWAETAGGYTAGHGDRRVMVPEDGDRVMQFSRRNGHRRGSLKQRAWY